MACRHRALTQRGRAVLLGRVSLWLLCSQAGTELPDARTRISSESNSAAASVVLCRACSEAHWRVTPPFASQGLGGLWEPNKTRHRWHHRWREIPCLGPCLNSSSLSHAPCKKGCLWSFIPHAFQRADEANWMVSTPGFGPSILPRTRTVLLSRVAPGSALTPAHPPALPAPSFPAVPSLRLPWAPARRLADHRCLPWNRWGDTGDFWLQCHTSVRHATPEWLPIKGASFGRIYLCFLQPRPGIPGGKLWVILKAGVGS